MTVTISDKAKAVQALLIAFEELEAEQLKIGEQQAQLIFDQVRVAEKCRALKANLALLLVP